MSDIPTARALQAAIVFNKTWKLPGSDTQLALLLDNWAKQEREVTIREVLRDIEKHF